MRHRLISYGLQVCCHVYSAAELAAEDKNMSQLWRTRAHDRVVRVIFIFQSGGRLEFMVILNVFIFIIIAYFSVYSDLKGRRQQTRKLYQ